MSVSAIILAAVVVGGTGIVIGIILGIAGEKFKVEVDPKEEEVLAALPGNNCGGCGFVPVWLQQLQKVKQRLVPVRLAVLRLRPRSVRSWVRKLANLFVKLHL